MSFISDSFRRREERGWTGRTFYNTRLDDTFISHSHFPLAFFALPPRAAQSVYWTGSTLSTRPSAHLAVTEPSCEQSAHTPRVSLVQGKGAERYSEAGRG